MCHPERPCPSFFMWEMIYIHFGQARLTATGLSRPWGKVRWLRSQADLPLGAIL
jgi:hypothetical protein